MSGRSPESGSHRSEQALCRVQVRLSDQEKDSPVLRSWSGDVPKRGSPEARRNTADPVHLRQVSSIGAGRMGSGPSVFGSSRWGLGGALS